MAVLRPLKVVITNYPEGEAEEFSAINNPEDESMGVRNVPFSRELYIERDDFMEDPPRRFYRLAPGREVRLRYACLITCTDVVKDADGNVTEVHCTFDPDSRGGNAPDGRRVQGTIHWVSSAHAVPMEVRLYDNLFTDPYPASSDADFLDLINHDSLEVVKALAEPALADANPGDRYQFERLGYFCADPDSKPGAPVFNRTTTLRGHLGAYQPTAGVGGALDSGFRRNDSMKRVQHDGRKRVLKPKAPPIKTQGIKTKLVPFIAGHIEWDRQGRWVEPFLGSGGGAAEHQAAPGAGRRFLRSNRQLLPGGAEWADYRRTGGGVPPVRRGAAAR